MNRKTKIWAGVTVALAMTALVGCASGEASPTTNGNRPEQVQAFDVNLEDGRTVLCVWAKSGYGGGLSCDWTEVAR